MSEQKRFDDIFNDVFDGKNENPSTDDTGLSPIARKLKERKTRKTVEQYVSWLKTGGGASEASDPASHNADNDVFSYKHSLIKVEKGKHFSLPVEENTVTILYEIFKSCSYETKTRYYYVKKTDSIETIMADGRKYATYYIDPGPNGNQVVLLHFDKKGNFVLINSGLLIGDEMRISTHPTVLEFKPISVGKPRMEEQFQLDDLVDGEKADFLRGVDSFGNYDIDVNSTIVTIDTETFLPVPKRIYQENGEYKAKVTIKTGRNYFSFKVSSQDESDIELSEYEIALCFLRGYGDFPKDKIKAAEMFEQIGDAESLYELAHIWLDESHNDVESLQDGILCLEEAACQGHNAARAELVYYLMKLLCILPAAEQETVIAKYHEQIKCAVNTELPGALFLVAYVYEKGMFVNRDTDLAFSYYLRAAKADNDAAKARIGMAPTVNMRMSAGAISKTL